VKLLPFPVTRNAVMGIIYRAGLSRPQPPSDPGERKPQRPPRAPEVKRAPSQNNGLNASKRRPVTPAIVKPLIISGNNAVHEAPEPREPHVIIPKEAWAPLPGSTPRPWMERGNGCSWPVDVPGADVQHSCCRPKKPGHPNYCAEHQALGVSKADAGKPKGAELVRSLRRFAA
jgi:Uncharacterized protein conserved in bacteria